MRAHKQWMIRRHQIPLDPVHRRATNPLDPQNWLSYDQAVALAAQPNSADGVGFVLTEDDPFFFIDLDDHLVGGQWSAFSTEIVSRFAGAWVEVSHSGTGLHIYGRSRQIPSHACHNKPMGIELYSKLKHVHVTHLHNRGDSDHDCTEALLWLIENYFQPTPGHDSEEWTTGPRSDGRPIEDDGELLAAAFSATGAAAAFGAKASFGDLWEAREDVLGRYYPDPPKPYGASEADAALAQHLAFWTACDCERIERLMRQSKLYRDKWDDRGDYYLPRTIMRACAMQEDVYCKAEVVPPTQAAAEAVASGKQLAEMRSGLQYLAPSQILEYFAGCVYVIDSHKIFAPGHGMLDQSRFKSIYGGYIFALDTINDKTTDNAWTAFTESRACSFPKVNVATFRPDLEPGVVFTDEGRSMVNIYEPIPVESREGDVSPFLLHLRKILPDKRDAEILLSYMAACVQHKGIKFQWCPLIQGAEGNGKSLLTRAVTKAIGRAHSHTPKAKEIDSEFNGWLFQKIFIGVEDVRIPEKKADIMETLKPMITGEWQEVNIKYENANCVDICCNFMLNSNHKDALRKTSNDRRFAIFYCAQQSAEDIKRDGMGGSYFSDLYAWLRNGGYAMVTHFLEHYQIPDELNPAKGCQRAPETSSTAEALHASLGSIEQSILEAVEEERPGFAGGWISSCAVDTLLTNLRAARQIPPNKRRDLLQTLGYDWHPGLQNGRVNSPSDIDGGMRPKLFIRKGSILAEIPGGPAAIYNQYRAAQVHNPFAQGA